ncbi:MAG TPA: 3-oxoacyl-[acyl-carrier-protein] synthase III C-terminal domain-containing protein [Planctomycetota bacterium]|nr:3-oxoacyl-[acyl-carrier-protein] synthase III C-terminal domain-containing protein [Planctomycetota bacterium]
MRIAAVAPAFPRWRYTQSEICSRLEEIWSDHKGTVTRLPALLENTRVRWRHLSRPLAEYARPTTFGRSNDLWIATALELGEQAIGSALRDLGLAPRDIDAIFAVSVTGVCSPSLDARLANRMGFRSDVKRVPIFGLGCVAGVAGISRAADYVKAYPDAVAVVFSVELCSLTFQAGDRSLANLISAGLFGDGAAAVVVLGEERARRMGVRGLRVVDTRSVFYPDTEDLMGWTISERGFEIVLSPEVPRLAEERLGPDVDAFLASHGLAREDIASWVCHPGGPKVLEAVARGLELSEHDVRHAWASLAEHGNLSSTSVLMVLAATLAEASAQPGQRALLLAMGPAFCSEVVLAEWC